MFNEENKKPDLYFLLHIIHFFIVEYVNDLEAIAWLMQFLITNDFFLLKFLFPLFFSFKETEIN